MKRVAHKGVRLDTIRMFLLKERRLGLFRKLLIAFMRRRCRTGNMLSTSYAQSASAFGKGDGLMDLFVNVPPEPQLVLWLRCA